MTASDTVNTAQLVFTKEEQQRFQAFANAIVPADDNLSVPGAGDATIFADILSAAAARCSSIAEVLTELEQRSRNSHLRSFVEVASEQQLELIEQYRSEYPDRIWPLLSVIFTCYYRDDRVMLSIGMAARPPFPDGYEVEQGDWSLLDPVKAKAKIFRSTD